MIRKLPVLLLLLLLVSFSSNVSAQTATNAASKLQDQMQLIRDQKQRVVTKIKRNIKQEIKDSVQAKKEAVKEEVLIRREEFKAKLQTIRNEKKKVLVERIDTKLANVNTKHTDRFTQVLSNLQTVLDNKISDDLNKTEAQAAIDTAKLAVENQAAKTYAITISSETALKSDVGAVTSQLRQDLSATHKLVVDAKQAVQALRKDNAIMKKETTDSTSL